MAVSGSSGEEDISQAEEPADIPLAFEADTESLPWLDADDEEEEQGIDARRIAVFAAGAVALLALLVGMIWWFSHRGPDPELVADGGTIKAPAEPYKTRPDDPGGKTFEGTGDTSFVVSEGKTKEAQLAGSAPAPIIANRAKADGEATASGSAATASGAGAAASASAQQGEAIRGVAVQVGAYSTQDGAKAGWSALLARHAALQGVNHRIVEGKADIGTVYRLQAIKPDAGSANSLCAAIKADGGACQVKR